MVSFRLLHFTPNIGKEASAPHMPRVIHDMYYMIHGATVYYNTWHITLIVFDAKLKLRLTKLIKVESQNASKYP